MQRLQNQQAVVEKANNPNLAVDEDDIKELPEGVPEELTELFLELKQERITEEEKRKLQQEEKKKKNHQKRITRSFCRPQQAP